MGLSLARTLYTLRFLYNDATEERRQRGPIHCNELAAFKVCASSLERLCRGRRPWLISDRLGSRDDLSKVVRSPLLFNTSAAMPGDGHRLIGRGGDPRSRNRGCERIRALARCGSIVVSAIAAAATLCSLYVRLLLGWQVPRAPQRRIQRKVLVKKRRLLAAGVPDPE